MLRLGEIEDVQNEKKGKNADLLCNIQSLLLQGILDNFTSSKMTNRFKLSGNVFLQQEDRTIVCM